MNSKIPQTLDRAKPVLVVDDLPAARRIVVRMLKNLEFTSIIEAQTKSEAIARIKEHRFSFVVTDLHLKDGTGVALLAAAREDLSLNALHLPFIVITSDMDKESFTSAIKSGVTSYLLKPFSTDLLAERINTAIDTAR